MKLQQLRYVREISRQGLSISEAASTLHTSQPGVSKQLQLLEAELGVKIFTRTGNRLTGTTPDGQAILTVVEQVLMSADNLKAMAAELKEETGGTFTVVTTNTQATYKLPNIIKQFSSTYRSVRLVLRQGTPNQIWRMVLEGQADLAIASEPRESSPDLAMLPCYELPRVVLTQRDHKLLGLKRLTLEALAAYPIITYDDEYVARSKMLRVFAARGLVPDIVLTATDSNVIKAYVVAGLGVAIIASMAFDPQQDLNLRAIDASRIFDSNTVYVGFRRDAYLRRYALRFIEMLAPHLTEKTIQSQLTGSARRRD